MMAKLCCVCSESKENPENRLFGCKGHGCDVTVHQACYGIVSIPTGLWFCRKCESQERAARVRCELCPKKEGALKRTDSGGWAHVVCALYIPEVTFGNTLKMEPIVTSKLPKERFTKSCYLCEEVGLETQATYGACMSCHKSSCRLAFHVTCAQREHLLCEEPDPRDHRNIIYCGYCHTHFKKMIRMKYKQSLRKPVGTPTSTTAPSLPSPSTSSPSALPGLVKEKDSPPKIKPKELPQKRISMDAPFPPAKRKFRRKKLSTSDESTTSEAPSYLSDVQQLQQHTAATNMVPVSPSSTTAQSPVGGGLVARTSRKEITGDSLVQRMEVVGGGVSSQPLSPIAASLGLSTSQAVVGDRQQTSSTNSDQSAVGRAQGPPLSLHELLERQWEQTAQLILDQAGKQNNAGVMLAHLHQLQTENRRMQSRIMELASQREFYIATNTRLRLTLSEHELNRLPNGVQPLGGEGALLNIPPSSTEEQRSSDERSSVQSVLSASLPKAAQDSLLQAHFQATSLQSPKLSRSSPPPQHRSHPSASTSAHLYPPPQGLFPTTSSSTYPLGASTPPEAPNSLHEITRVINSVQAPITTFTPLPGLDSANTALHQTGGNRRKVNAHTDKKT